MSADEESTRVAIADRVYDALSAQFMSGVRLPGERLKLHLLSRELDVSPTPIREALARLEHTGFIERHSQRGYVVARLLEADEISQLMDARLLLEPGWRAVPRSARPPDSFPSSPRLYPSCRTRVTGQTERRFGSAGSPTRCFMG